MKTKNTYYTREGLEKLRERIRFLEEKEMPAISLLIGEASEKGDLSENAEYQAAKNRQRITSMQIQDLKQDIANAAVLDPKKIDTNQVSILTRVELKEEGTQRKYTYTLVSERESDMKIGKLSVTSPLGRGLLGKKVNEIATIEMPAPHARIGQTQQRSFKIIRISLP